MTFTASELARLKRELARRHVSSHPRVRSATLASLVADACMVGLSRRRQ